MSQSAESCGNDARMDRVENQRQVSHSPHSSLEISQRRRDSHIPTAPAVSASPYGQPANRRMRAVEKWKSKTGIPTFPQPRELAAQGVWPGQHSSVTDATHTQ